MKQFKIRCSAIGQIMGEPRLKKDKEAGLLSQTAKTYCETWLKEQLYSRRKEFSNKYTEKGLINEDNSIDFAADYLGYGFLIKNEERKENDFMTGECDVILPDLIMDIKNSWDAFTFPLFATEVPNKDYYAQGQGYMSLYNRNKYKLVYTLTDTPIHLIEKEAYFWCKNNGYEDLDDDILQRFYKKMTYSDIDPALKIKSFDFDRNDEYIAKIEQQVIKCRTYIEILINKL